MRLRRGWRDVQRLMTGIKRGLGISGCEKIRGQQQPCARVLRAARDRLIDAGARRCVFFQIDRRGSEDEECVGVASVARQNALAQLGGLRELSLVVKLVCGYECVGRSSSLTRAGHGCCTSKLAL